MVTSIANFVDLILLHSRKPNIANIESGGTGRIHNWEISKEIVKKIRVRVFLAGGLTPENALQAIKQMNPYGLDLCSGVRTNGLLDVDKLVAFSSAIKQI